MKKYYIHIDNASEEKRIANELTKQKNEQDLKIAEKQLEVKDRVDISLKEYDELKQELEILKKRTKYQEKLLSDIKIDPTMEYSNIETRIEADPFRCKKIYVIRLELSDFEIMKRGIK